MASPAVVAIAFLIVVLIAVGQPVLVSGGPSVVLAGTNCSKVGPLTVPSPERVAQAEDNYLVDELIIVVGPSACVQAEAAARAVGGVVTGGIKSSGIYQVRWLSRQDLSERKAELEAVPGVVSVSYSSVNQFGPDEVHSAGL